MIGEDGLESFLGGTGFSTHNVKEGVGMNSAVQYCVSRFIDLGINLRQNVFKFTHPVLMIWDLGLDELQIH